MKILFITPWYPYKKSINHGVFVQDQAFAVGRDHEVLVVASEVDYDQFDFSSGTVEIVENSGIKEHRITVRRSIPFYNQFNFFWITLRYARKVAREFKPDIIHGNIGFPGAVWAWTISYFTGAPFLVTEHTSRFTMHFRSRWHKFLTLWPMKKSDSLVAVSNFTADEIFRYTGKQPVVIGNIIRVSQYVRSPEKDRRAGDVCRVGFLGVLANDKKGLDILLHAIAPLNENFILHIGGGGPMLSYYKDLAAELGVANRCIFHGEIANWKVPAFMEELDFFVSASRFESFGMVMVEAMALGLPVVATDSGGPRDFINAENGLLVPKEDPEKLRNALRQMLHSFRNYDPDRIQRFVRENYSPEVFLRKINLLYNQLIDHRR